MTSSRSMFSGKGAARTSEIQRSTTVRSLYTGIRIDSFMSIKSSLTKGLLNWVLGPFQTGHGRFSLRVALLQINPTAGDIAGNSALIVERREAFAGTGRGPGGHSRAGPNGLPAARPPDEPRLRAEELRGVEPHRRELADAPSALIGVATPNPAEMGRPLFNSAVLVRGGEVGPAFHKTLLPTYDVFDEDRYFEPAREPGVLELNGWRLGISICEDVWNDRDFWHRRRYHIDPIEELTRKGAQAIINLSASPFTVGKQVMRQRDAGADGGEIRRAVDDHEPGRGQRRSDLRRPERGVRRAGPAFCAGRGFEPDVIVIDLDGRTRRDRGGRLHSRGGDLERSGAGCPRLCAEDALPKGAAGVVGRHRLGSHGGDRGGSDGAGECARRDDAVGVFERRERRATPRSLLKNLGIRSLKLPISGIMQAYDEALAEAFRGLPPDVTEENIQSRIRGALLMALSNKFGALLLTTGNKSEMSVGYCTLYGDMNGGLAVIADLPKMMVYRVSRWRNRRKPDIPEAILTKAPSAELRPNQTDQDSLPPYELLDQILELHVEQSQSAEEIIAQGYDEATVRRVLRLVRIAEFKRKQAAPVLKVTSRAFGTGWRMPIVRQE